MKLTDADKQYILEKIYGGAEQTFRADLRQIEDAADCTTYEVWKTNAGHGKKLTLRGAIRLLGREAWLSGLVRSAFHWDACRITRDGREVMFDSRELFWG